MVESEAMTLTPDIYWIG